MPPIQAAFPKKISEETEASLRELVDDLLEVNSEHNLTAIREAELAWEVHIIDSLMGLGTNCFAGAKEVVDIGSGPGFPGLPLAIACPALAVTFVESVGKKCAFIEAAIEQFDLQGRVLCDRAELLGKDPEWRGQFDVATSRAVGSFSEVCEYALPFLAVHGHAVLWRGSNGLEEANAASRALSQLGAELVSVTPYRLGNREHNFHLVVIRKVRKTPGEFPRAVGIPKQRPL